MHPERFRIRLRLEVHAAEDVQAIGYSWNGSYLRSPRTGLFSAGANAHGHGQLGRDGAVLGPMDVPDTLRVGARVWERTRPERARL
jgi:hypothetical protein